MPSANSAIYMIAAETGLTRGAIRINVDLVMPLEIMSRNWHLLAFGP